MHLAVRLPSARTAAVLACVLLSAGPVLAQGNEDALFVSVPNPLNSDGFTRIKRVIESRRNTENRSVRKIVLDFNPEGKPALTTDFGPCSDLAKFIRTLQGATTVAFVHGKVSGHTVLPVLACKELVMSKEGSIGEITTEGVRALQSDEELTYKLLLDRDSHLAIVKKMYDKDVILGRGVKQENGNLIDWYVDMRQEKAELGKIGISGQPARVKFAQDGQLGLFTSDQARELGLSKATVESRRDLAELYGLSAASIRDDILQGRTPEAFRYTLKGEVDSSMRSALGRVIKEVKRKKGNVLFLTIDCSGGDLEAARALADDLRAAQTGDDAILIVGFIPDSAPDSGTFVALGCSDIVMSKGKDGRDGPQEAVIGDFETVVKGGKPGAADAYRKSLKELAEQQGYDGLLIDGMFDKDLEIIRVVGTKDRTQRRLMSREAFEADQANWQQERVVKHKGQLLKLSATQAADLGLARFTVDTRDPAPVYGIYGVDPSKVREATPGWLDQFAEFIQIPVVTVLLVVIGFTGLILELKVPGLTVPGIIAALCFILVFWAHSRFSGEVFVLALLLFILGLVLIGMEIFVLPGFGAPGVIGILLMLGGLGLVTFERVPTSADEWAMLGVKVSQYMLAGIASFVLAFVIARFLPKVPYANRLMLASPADRPDAAESVLPGAGEAASLLGAIGTTNTTLRPAGVVKFADKFVDVVSDGGFIPAGTRVQVIAVEGTRIVVKEV